VSRVDPGTEVGRAVGRSNAVGTGSGEVMWLDGAGSWTKP
jgi:hypothetical protein